MKESLCRLPRISSCKPGLSWEVEVESMKMFLIMWEWKTVILMDCRYEQGHWHLVDAHLSQAGLLDRLATAVELHKPEGGGES